MNVTETPGILAKLSRRVLYASATMLSSMDSRGVAGFLYHANWWPLSPTWLHRFPDQLAVAALLQDGETGDLLKQHWIANGHSEWLFWQSRRAAAEADNRFKLYISARPTDIAQTFIRAIPVLSEMDAPTFKVSKHPRSLLRPDRMVVYLPTRAVAQDVGLALGRALGEEAPAQGVPFTAAVVESGLVSWGCDPPAAVRRFAGSWRQWITRKLAGYLCASDAPSAAGRVEFALARLGEDGVDTDRWAPREGVWALSR